MNQCPHCKSDKIAQVTPITDSKNKTKFYHAICESCNKELRLELDGQSSDHIEHDKSWLDDLSSLIDQE